MGYILAIDQGTTSTRAILFSEKLDVVAIAQKEFKQHFPQPGWVEHDPEDLWATVVSTVNEVLARAGKRASDVAALGITNQRETTVVWDRKSGRAIHNAIVWQDRRTAERCAELKKRGIEDLVRTRTGLIVDPYFSGTKIAWILDKVDGARAAAERGDLAFGTVDSFLLWRMTGGKVHATDATNASRSMIYDIEKGVFDAELMEIVGVPKAVLPEVRDSAGLFGVTEAHLFGAEIRVCGIAGDQQAAVVGQACFEPGMMKVTYGTGAFALLNVGDKPVASQNRLLTTVAYQLDGKRTFALEGAIFVAGAAVQWLRDGLGIIKHASETQGLAMQADPNQEVYLVPAFTGLGAPYWEPEARGVMTGLSRGAGRAELARAALESVGYQTFDLYQAMRADWPEAASDTTLRVDGGMAASDWTMQFLADVLDAKVDRPEIAETTALGAAYLAGYAAGICPPPEEFGRSWRLQRQFIPKMDVEARRKKLAGWADAVRRTRRFSDA
jgi:glycerol kinase